MAYHHALACISSPQAYIINRRLYRFRNDDIQGLRLDLFTKLWYNNFNNIKFDKGVQLYEIHFC